jgi:hypothetical protein
MHRAALARIEEVVAAEACAAAWDLNNIVFDNMWLLDCMAGLMPCWVHVTGVFCVVSNKVQHIKVHLGVCLGTLCHVCMQKRPCNARMWGYEMVAVHCICGTGNTFFVRCR